MKSVVGQLLSMKEIVLLKPKDRGLQLGTDSYLECGLYLIVCTQTKTLKKHVSNYYTLRQCILTQEPWCPLYLDSIIREKIWFSFMAINCWGHEQSRRKHWLRYAISALQFPFILIKQLIIYWRQYYLIRTAVSKMNCSYKVFFSKPHSLRINARTKKSDGQKLEWFFLKALGINLQKHKNFDSFEVDYSIFLLTIDIFRYKEANVHIDVKSTFRI